MMPDVSNTGTHFHQGEIVIYTLATGCPYMYSDAVYCPACGGNHRCGAGCAA